MTDGKALVDLTIIMPVYNEEKIITESIKQTLGCLDTSGINYEIIVVDDGSTDGSLEVLDSFADRIKILSYETNKGKGYALKFGAQIAKGSVVAFYDSDLNIDPSHLVSYYNIFRGEAVDVVIGSKRVRGSEVASSFVRKLLSVIYHLFAKALLGVTVMDSQVGIKLFKRSVLDRVLPALTVDRFALDVEILALISQFNYKIKEAPVKINFRTDVSSIEIRSIERMFVDTFRIYYKLRLTRNPRLIYSVIELSKFEQ